MNASFVIYDSEFGVLTEDYMKAAQTKLELRDAPAYVNKLGG